MGGEGRWLVELRRPRRRRLQPRAPRSDATTGDAAQQLPAIDLVFSLARRWLLATHHGAVGKRHPPAYLDQLTFRFDRRTAKSVSHRFARVIQQAVLTRPTTDHGIVAGGAAA